MGIYYNRVDETIERYKMRLVAKAYMQSDKIDYQENEHYLTVVILSY